MAVNVYVKKQGGENSANVLKKFSFKVRASGVLSQARKVQYRERPKSRNMRKRSAVVRMKRRQFIEKLIKEGRIPERRSKNIPTNTSGNK